MRIDVFHDTVCPWCRIGKRQLDLALADWDGPNPTVGWRPFLLDASVPVDGQDFGAYMTERKGAQNLEPMFEAVRRAGAAVGLRFDLEKVRFATNTVRSHVLLASAPVEKQSDLLDAVHRAYFEDGRDIGDIATLVDIAVVAGLDGRTTAAALADLATADAILRDAQAAHRSGISSVPLFLLEQRRVVSGAQPPSVLLEAMRTALAEEPVDRGA